MLIKIKQQTTEETDRFTGNMRANYKILDGLSVYTRIGANYSNRFIEILDPKFTVLDSDGIPIARTIRFGISNRHIRTKNGAWESRVIYFLHTKGQELAFYSSWLFCV